MKLDFVMKLFLALIVVFFIIISVYYTANGLASLFGINFKIKKPGLYNGNLEKLGVKNITNIKVGEATFSDCLSYCKSDPFEPHMFGNCEDQCSFICNQTNGCITITGEFRIATLSGYAVFSIEKNKLGSVVIDSETFDKLPEVIYLEHTFFLPKGNDYSNTNISWRTGETTGVINIGKTHAISLASYGSKCDNNDDLISCSKFNETTQVYEGTFDSTHKSRQFSPSACNQVSIELKSNCDFPIYIDETDKWGNLIERFEFDHNGTYFLACPNSGNKFSLDSNLDNCYVNYNLTVFEGLTENNNIACYENVIGSIPHEDTYLYQPISSSQSGSFSITGTCQKISIELGSCTFPIYINETNESGNLIENFKFDSSGTYGLICPNSNNFNLTSNSSSVCYYNLTIESEVPQCKYICSTSSGCS